MCLVLTIKGKRASDSPNTSVAISLTVLAAMQVFERGLPPFGYWTIETMNLKELEVPQESLGEEKVCEPGAGQGSLSPTQRQFFRPLHSRDWSWDNGDGRDHTPTRALHCPSLFWLFKPQPYVRNMKLDWGGNYWAPPHPLPSATTANSSPLAASPCIFLFNWPLEDGELSLACSRLPTQSPTLTSWYHFWVLTLTTQNLKILPFTRLLACHDHSNS